MRGGGIIAAGVEQQVVVVGAHARSRRHLHEVVEIEPQQIEEALDRARRRP
jgi:hypothetical protein